MVGLRQGVLLQRFGRTKQCLVLDPIGSQHSQALLINVVEGDEIVAGDDDFAMGQKTIPAPDLRHACQFASRQPFDGSGGLSFSKALAGDARCG